MNTPDWYQNLIKPSWAPPASVFGPIWTFLYALIIISYGYVFYQFFKGKISFMIILPFILNLVFNFAFTPIQFILRDNTLAFLDILLVLTTLIWAIVAIYPTHKWISYINAPYLVWVIIATTLQISITYLNR